MRKPAVALAAVTLLLSATVAPATAEGDKKPTVYEPPYKEGPSGGDEFNHVERDADGGSMAILRTFPGIPPVVGCAPEPSAGWGMFRVKHKVKEPVSKIVLDYDAALDPYSWVTVGARDAKGKWMGVKKVQGPSSGSGKLTATLFDRPRSGDTITIEFGLQLGDACPQIGGAAAMFPSVGVR